MQHKPAEFKIDPEIIDNAISWFNLSLIELKKSMVAPNLGWLLLLFSLSIKLPHGGKLRFIAALCIIYQDIQNEKKFNAHDAKLDDLRRLYQLCLEKGPKITYHSSVMKIAKTIAPFVHRSEICPWTDLMDLHRVNPELDKILAKPPHDKILPRVNNEHLYIMDEFYSLPAKHVREQEVNENLKLALRIHKTGQQITYGSNSIWAQLFAKGVQTVFSSEAKLPLLLKKNS